MGPSAISYIVLICLLLGSTIVDSKGKKDKGRGGGRESGESGESNDAQKIKDLVGLVRTTLKGMGDVAVKDNAEIGAKIATKLDAEIARATKIMENYSDTTTKARHRHRRAVQGDAAYNSIGQVLVESNAKIEPEKGQLSPRAQKRIYRKYVEGVRKCGADSCKAAAKTLNDVDDADDQRQ